MADTHTDAADIADRGLAELSRRFPDCHPEELLRPLLVGVLGGANIVIDTAEWPCELALELCVGVYDALAPGLGPLQVIDPEAPAGYGDAIVGPPVARTFDHGGRGSEPRGSGPLAADAALLVLHRLEATSGSTSSAVKRTLGDEMSTAGRALRAGGTTVEMPGLLAVIATVDSRRTGRQRPYSAEFAYQFDIGVEISPATVDRDTWREFARGTARPSHGEPVLSGSGVRAFRAAAASLDVPETEAALLRDIVDWADAAHLGVAGVALRVDNVAQMLAASAGRAVGLDEQRRSLVLRQRAHRALIGGAPSAG